MYIYESHMGGLFYDDENLPFEDLYCEACGDCDRLICEADNAHEFWDRIKDDVDLDGNGGYAPEYIRTFAKEAFDENIGPLIYEERRTEEMSIEDAARYVIFQAHNYEDCYITPMKLQKLLYLAQGWSFVWDQTEIFPEEFEAWETGPVNEYIQDLFGCYKRDEIPACEGDTCTLEPKPFLETLDVIAKEYGHKTDHELAELTKGQDPWKQARAKDGRITNKMVKDYFLSTY